jgi:hypothetical protein
LGEDPKMKNHMTLKTKLKQMVDDEEHQTGFISFYQVS